jgi:hypothetical protein
MTRLKGITASSRRQIDQPIAALLTDLKQRGMFDDTLVSVGGRVRADADRGTERRRQVASWGAITTTTGFPCGWRGGNQGGEHLRGDRRLRFQGGETKPTSVHDLHATMLHLLGFDHEKLTFRYAGRDFRLTDVHGRVVREILA